MNKTELVEKVRESTGLSKKDSEQVVKAVFEVMQGALSDGEKIQIPGFGTFSVKERAERVGINPRTKEKVTFPSSKSVKFSQGKLLKESVNA